MKAIITSVLMLLSAVVFGQTKEVFTVDSVSFGRAQAFAEKYRITIDRNSNKEIVLVTIHELSGKSKDKVIGTAMKANYHWNCEEYIGMSGGEECYVAICTEGQQGQMLAVSFTSSDYDDCLIFHNLKSKK